MHPLLKGVELRFEPRSVCLQSPCVSLVWAAFHQMGRVLHSYYTFTHEHKTITIQVYVYKLISTFTQLLMFLLQQLPFHFPGVAHHRMELQQRQLMTEQKEPEHWSHTDQGSSFLSYFYSQSCGQMILHLCLSFLISKTGTMTGESTSEASFLLTDEVIVHREPNIVPGMQKLLNMCLLLCSPSHETVFSAFVKGIQQLN